MEKYLYNPEVKKSFLFIIITAFITIISIIFIINIDYNNVKINYVKNNIALIGRVTYKHPELETDLVKILISEPNESQIIHGENIMKKYGIDTKLPMKFVPEIQKTYENIIKQILIVLGIFIFFIVIFFYVQYARIYKILEKTMFSCKAILDNKFDMEIDENCEGTFGKFIYSFNKMRIIMKKNFTNIKSKKNFLVDVLSNISHQLKTPISALIIYNDILINRNLSEKKRLEFLQNSEKQLNRMEWLIKSLLKLAKLDAGVIKFNKKSNDLNKTVKEAIKILIPKSTKENITLKFNSNESKILIKHDANWMQESITNLIKNAIEHTDKGGCVEIFTQKTVACTRIIVKDNGVGISKGDMPHIFERFYKGKENKNVESVGIGLALSKSIIEGNGGIIEVKSQEKKGTIFNIVFLSYS